MKIGSTHDSKDDGLKCLIIGQPGVGKTFLASTLPHIERTLFISAENGHRTLADFDIPIIDITKDDDGRALNWNGRLNKLRELRSYLLSDDVQEKYDHIFFDSLTEIGEIFFHTLQEKYPDKNKTIVLYGELSRQVELFIKFVRDLPKFNVFLTALERTEKDDAMRTRYICNLKGSIAWTVPKFFDEVYSLRIFKKEDQIVRAFQTLPIDGYEGKSRSNKLNDYEPANLAQLLEKINA